jgi:CPA2 family monovalent cation:H+ antiporter-2
LHVLHCADTIIGNDRQKISNNLEKKIRRAANQMIEYGARDLDNHFIITGFGKVGKIIARVLEVEGDKYMVNDVNDDISR